MQFSTLSCNLTLSSLLVLVVQYKPVVLHSLTRILYRCRRFIGITCAREQTAKLFVLSKARNLIIFALCYLYSVIRTLLSVLCYLLSVICTLLSVLCYLYSVICTLYSKEADNRGKLSLVSCFLCIT